MYPVRMANRGNLSDLAYWHLREMQATKNELELQSRRWSEFVKLKNEIRQVDHLVAVAIPDHYKATSLSLIDSLSETEAIQKIIEKLERLIQGEPIKEVYIQNRPIVDYLEFLKEKWEQREKIRKKLIEDNINDTRLKALAAILAQENSMYDAAQAGMDDAKEIEAIKKELKASYNHDQLNHYFKAINGIAEYAGMDGFERTAESFQRDAMVDEGMVEYFAMHPRAWFLLTKKNYLENKYKSLNAEIKDKIPDEKVHEEIKIIDPRQAAVNAFDIGKKIIDVLDEIWTAIQDAIPKNPITQVLGFGLTGSIGFIVGIAEGYRGIKIAYKAYQNAETKQRKTRIFRGVSAFALGGAAAGMSLTLFMTALGVSIAAAPLLTVLIPTVVTAIYAVGLWKNSYVLYQTKIEEKKAKEDYEKFLGQYTNPMRDLQKNLNALEEQRAVLIKEELNSALQNVQTPTSLQTERIKIDAEILITQKKLGELRGIQEGKRKYFEYTQKVRQEKEAKVAFSSIEVAAAALVVVGATLAVAAMIGLGVVSFGAVPLAITLVGVGIGVTAKIIEKVDEKKDHRLSKAMRGFFAGIGNKIVNVFKPKQELIEQPSFEMKKNESRSYKLVDDKHGNVFGSTYNMDEALHINPHVNISTPTKTSEHSPSNPKQGVAWLDAVFLDNANHKNVHEDSKTFKSPQSNKNNAKGDKRTDKDDDSESFGM